MSATLDWAKFVFAIIRWIATMALTVLFYYVAFKAYRMWMASMNPVLNRRGAPSGRVFVRSLFCRHRHIARVKDPYGRLYSACMRCSHDVNRGKPREEWR